MDTNLKMSLNLKRSILHNEVVARRYGGTNSGMGYSDLEQIKGTYQIGTSKGSIEIVWQPSTGRFYETNIKSNTSVWDTLKGYVTGFRGQNQELQSQVEGEYRSLQPGVVEVLEKICVDYLQIPISNISSQRQLGAGKLEELADGEVKKLNSQEVNKANIC